MRSVYEIVEIDCEHFAVFAAVIDDAYPELAAVESGLVRPIRRFVVNAQILMRYAEYVFQPIPVRLRLDDVYVGVVDRLAAECVTRISVVEFV